VLDLFAGTGALGIEAVSRGAKFTLFVANGSEAARCWRNNVERSVWRRHKSLSATPPISARPIRSSRSRLVFLDPPMQRAGGKSAGLAARRGWLDAGRAAGGGRSQAAAFAAPDGFEDWSDGCMTIPSSRSCV